MVCLPLLVLLSLLTPSSPRPSLLRLPYDPYEEPEPNFVRAERSTNISHIVGTSRKIQLIVSKSWYLQIHADGAVNGTDSATDSDYTILQRVSVSQLHITIQGVATCQFLCMDSCGLLYGSRHYTEECLFNEMIEAHHFNTYSSAKYSNDKRTLFLGLTKRGVPRKVQTKARVPLGKLSSFTNVLTKHVPKPRVEELALRMMRGRYYPQKHQIHPMLRHHGHHQLCAYLPPAEPLDTTLRCHRQKKKKKRKCEDESDDCETSRLTPAEKKKCEDGEEEEECQRRLHMIRKKRKSRPGEEDVPEKDSTALKKKRLRSEKKRDEDKSKKLKSKCLNVSKSDAKAYNDCVMKKGLRKKLRVEQGRKVAATTSPDDETTTITEAMEEALLWEDRLDEAHTNHRRELEELSHQRPELEDLSAGWTTSSAMPN